jgi:hypothetical protein
VALPYSHIEPEHTWQATASNNHVVEGIKLFGATVTMVDRGTERHARLRRPALGMEGIEGRLNLERFSAGKKPDLAKVDAEERGGGAGDSRGGTQEGAVASE